MPARLPDLLAVLFERHEEGADDKTTRLRRVEEPSAVLASRRVLLAQRLGVLEQEVEIRVWDSSAEVRYMVLPMRPENSDGLNESQLAALVTRDSMIGVELLT